jgi:hypothetical protein
MRAADIVPEREMIVFGDLRQGYAETFAQVSRHLWALAAARVKGIGGRPTTRAVC